MSQKEPVIVVEGLSKSYQISHKATKRNDTIKDSFANLLRHPVSEDHGDKHETFWALDDVSFTVNRGEVFGIIGRNGSGKSTMLKILSRIVTPTKGSADLKGRTASLLEVGTGFHPELTGRENIYFNGSMLGMSRREIRKKFDEIVAFSEVEKFIDTPVKFYSSGMYVRLAFSVAAHLEPEILILDEVLAVGDTAFQKKSLNKIMSIMEQGSTVLFVSHSMGAVQQLCSRGLLLNKGKVEFVGKTDELTNRYNEFMRVGSEAAKGVPTWNNKDLPENEYFNPKAIYIEDTNGKKSNGKLTVTEDYWFCVEGDLKTDSELFNIGYILRNTDNKSTIYMCLSTDTKEANWPKLKRGQVKLRGKIPRNTLNGGNFELSLISSLHNQKWIFDPEENTPSVQVTINTLLNYSSQWIGTRTGAIAPVLEWEISNNG